MFIRAETPQDYATVADVNVKAFGSSSRVAAIVALLRQRRKYEPALSLVAEEDGVVVGHVLLSPTVIRLLGQSVPTVFLAPLGVDPAFQNRGIGESLIRAGHDVARHKFAVSFLLGHSYYYPRFGYRTHAFGTARATISKHDPMSLDVQTRNPEPADVAALREIWFADQEAVAFSLDPGPDLGDWLSPNPAVCSTVYVIAGSIAGYTRIHSGDPLKPRVFIARDAVAATRIATCVTGNSAVGSLTVPVHPLSRCAAACRDVTCVALGAAMAVSLQPSPLEEYFERRESENSPAGSPTWPVAFDLE